MQTDVCVSNENTNRPTLLMQLYVDAQTTGNSNTSCSCLISWDFCLVWFVSVANLNNTFECFLFYVRLNPYAIETWEMNHGAMNPYYYEIGALYFHIHTKRITFIGSSRFYSQQVSAVRSYLDDSRHTSNPCLLLFILIPSFSDVSV